MTLLLAHRFTSFKGGVNDNQNLSLTLIPDAALPGIITGQVTVSGKLLPDGTMTGEWRSTIGTAGVFTAHRHVSVEHPRTPRVFVVHGHDGELKESVARFLERFNLEVIILHEKANSGRTIIEKFELNADVNYAIILLTPDDEGHRVGQSEESQPRARQNVILELGYFVGRLGRTKICALHKGNLELPSDMHGILYVAIDHNDGWKLKLALELKQSGFDIDFNRMQ